MTRSNLQAIVLAVMVVLAVFAGTVVLTGVSAAAGNQSDLVVEDGESIQAHVDNAQSGDTVVVGQGTYKESVTIKTDNITLRGINRPTIVGDGADEGSQPHAAIHVDDESGPVRNVTIEGFTVRNPSGNFGIFAGTGTTNGESDGIGGLVVQNNVVENISTQTTGQALTGGPAGIDIRADYGTSGNPGIEIRDNEITNVQSESSVNAVGITLKSFTGDAGFGKNSSGNDVSDPSSPPATHTNIVNNDISNIAGGDGSRAKGISVSGEFEDVLVKNNSLNQISASGDGTALGVTLTENSQSFSGNQYDIDNDGNGERIGPRHFTIIGNEFDQINAANPESVFTGGYEEYGNSYVRYNNISGPIVRWSFGDQPGFQVEDADTLDARLNWYGDDRASNATVGGNAVYDPFLTAPKDAVSQPPSETQQYGHDLVIPRDGGLHSIAFPGSVQGNVSEVFGFNASYGLEAGETLYAYDAENEAFLSGAALADREVSSLDAFIVSVNKGTDPVRLAVDFDDSETPRPPGSADVAPGWNFAGASQSGPVSDAFSAGTATLGQVAHLYPGPASQPFTPGASPTFTAELDGTTRVSAYTGYWVYVNDQGEIAAVVQPGVTAEGEVNQVNSVQAK